MSKWNLVTLLTVLTVTTVVAPPIAAQQSSQDAEYEAAVQEFEEAMQQFEDATLDLREANEAFQEFQDATESFEQTLESTLEELSPGYTDGREMYLTQLETCSPHIFEHSFPGPTVETIRGWAGERCQVDRSITVANETRSFSCLYSRRDIELIKGPELYLSEDLDRQCKQY